MDARRFERVFFGVIEKAMRQLDLVHLAHRERRARAQNGAAHLETRHSLLNEHLSSCRSAAATASESISGVSTRVMPNDEPARAGLTNRG